MRHLHLRIRAGARAGRGVSQGAAGPRAGIDGLRRSAGLYGVAAALATALALGVLGCSSGKQKVDDVAWKFIEAIKKQDMDTMDKIIDWQRYYAYGKDKDPKTGEVKSDIDVEKEKTFLLSVMARDRILALNYLAARNSIADTSLHGDEARVEVLQTDRATGEERTITLLLHRQDNGEWKIYRFSTESSGKKKD